MSLRSDLLGPDLAQTSTFNVITTSGSKTTPIRHMWSRRSIPSDDNGDVGAAGWRGDVRTIAFSESSQGPLSQ